MRLTLAGKIVLYIVVLAGLYALWTRVPHTTRRVEFRKPAPRVEAPAAPVPESHEGIRIGYTGAPPALDAAPLKEVGAALQEAGGVAEILAGLQSGALDAAVLDFPCVVYASRAGATPFHTVLLVSWRKGADVITVKSGGPWQPAGFTDFTPHTSGEYLARLALESSRYSPQEKSAGRNQLNAEDAGARSGAPDAAAGRLDRMAPRERGWPVDRTSEDLDAPMPDVLVVNTEWARDNAAKVTALVRAIRAGQDSLLSDKDRWAAWLRAWSQTLGRPEAEVAEQMRPAPLEDQLAFVGLAPKGMKYTEVVLRQLRALQPGPRPPDDVTVRVDPRPLLDAEGISAG